MMNKLLPLLARPGAPAAAVLAGLVGALALQHVFGWAPCPLCILQRLTAIALALCLWAWAWCKPSRARDLALAAAVAFAVTGIWAAGAHLWILFGPQDGACGPGVARFVGHLVDALPGSEWLLEGGGACEDARYQLLGLPLPAWAGALHLVGASWALALRLRRGR